MAGQYVPGNCRSLLNTSLSVVGVVDSYVLNCRGARGSIRYVKQLKDPLTALHTAGRRLLVFSEQ